MKAPGWVAHSVQVGYAFTTMLSLLLTSCGGGGGSASHANLPVIQAILLGLPPGKQAPAGFANATASVQSAAAGGTAITNATVSMNGVPLVYNSAPSHQEYEGTVDVNPGDPVTLAVTTGGQTYTASGTEFTAYPALSAPASGDAWSVASAYYYETWSGGAPLANAVFLAGLLDATDPNGIAPIIHTYPNNQTDTLVLGSSLTPGTWDAFAGIAGEAAVANADPSSGFVYGGFDFVLITVYEWTSRPINGVMTGLVWNGSQFVAVGLNENDGLIFTSPDAITWTPQTVPGTSPSDLHAVVWSGTQWVAVGDNGIVLTSTDGVGWTRNNSYASLIGVASSGVVYAGVDALGNIYTSPDANTWALQATVPGRGLSGITWSGTQFVAVGALGGIYLSPDGVTWTVENAGSPSYLYAVARNGTQVVAVGDNLVVTQP